MYRFQFQVISNNWDLLLNGVWLTVRLSSLATLSGFALGTLGALARTSGNRILNAIASTYVEVIRNTPFLVQLLFIFFGIPNLGLRLSTDQAALLALSINFGAYATEILRAGIASVERGQIDAGLALGFNRIQVFQHVILTPAIANIYPALANQIVLLVLISSVASQISAEELTFAGNFLRARTFRDFEIYLTIACLYICLSLILKFIAYLTHQWLFRFTRYT